MSLKRRTRRLEERSTAPADRIDEILLRFHRPVSEEAGGGVKVRAETLPVGVGVPDSYFYQPEEGEEQEITQEEYESLPPATHTLPDRS